MNDPRQPFTRYEPARYGCDSDTGTNFTGATAVSFNGVAASFTVNSPISITATVPANAVTGPVTVTTPLGSTSNGVIMPCAWARLRHGW